MQHFSDGEKIVCGVKTGSGVTDPQQVDCKSCQKWIADTAAKKDDPIVKVYVTNKDIKPGEDFNFNYEGTDYHMISGAVHRIPRSVARHLAGLEYPISEYKKDQEPGQSIVSIGMYQRFSVTPVTPKI